MNEKPLIINGQNIPRHSRSPDDNQNRVPLGQRVVGTSPITGGVVLSGPKSSYKPKKTK